MSSFNVNDRVEILQPDLKRYSPSSCVAHFGRITKTDEKCSEVVIEMSSGADFFTDYVPLTFNNEMLIKI